MSIPNFQDNSLSLEGKIRRHEDNLRFLTDQKNQLDESILDLQVSLVKYHSTNGAGSENKNRASDNDEETMEQILRQEKTAACILCQLNSKHASQALNLAFTKDVLGIVANLARVDNDNISRLLSEYLGLETMLAIVCKTFEGVKALETYDDEGALNSSSGLHGLGSSIGKKINGRFTVICLEDLRQYVGGFVPDDPQKKLALPKPKLPNGECPDGFIDYAVNIIKLESRNLSCLTNTGFGLRETLFYSLFSQMQIYITRAQMLLALPCIHEGALSLDGGMIKKSGVFALGSRRDMDVRFPVTNGESDIPASYTETENTIRMLKWERTSIAEDISREEDLLEHAKAKFTGQT